MEYSIFMWIHTPSSSELSLEKLNEHFFPNIKFLAELQIEFRNWITIDQQWNIRGIASLTKNHPVIAEKQKIARKVYEESKSQYQGSRDVQIINGAIIFTFDSRMVLPPIQRGVKSRGNKIIRENEGITYSIIWIDINSDRRKEEAIPPETTLHHEYQHHLNVTLWDSLLFQATWGQYHSLERGSEKYIWHPHPARSRSELTGFDNDLVSALMGRSVNLLSHPAQKTPDYISYEHQMAYFDELSASYGQFKENALFPSMQFYNNLPHSFGEYGDHYRLIEGNETDRQELRELFWEYLMPVFALKYKIEELEKIIWRIKWNVTKITTGERTKEEQELEKISRILTEITQILWVSRSVHHALMLMRKYWKKEIIPGGISWLSESHLQIMHTWAKNHLHQYL